MDIDIIVDTDFLFALIISVQTANILGKRTFPGDGHCQQDRIQTRFIKPFAYILSGSDHHKGFICWNCSQGSQFFTFLFLLSAAQKQKYMIRFAPKGLLQTNCVLLSFSQQQRCSSLRNYLDCVRNQEVISCLILRNTRIDILDRSGVRQPCSGKARNCVMREAPLFCLVFCID